MTPVSTAPFCASLSVHGLHFTVCAPPKFEFESINFRGGFAILRACYRARKPPKPENTKKIQNPPPRVGPRKYGKNTEKIRKRPKTAIFGPFLYFFRYFFRISGGQPGVGDFVFFRIFGLWGFSGSVAGPQDRKGGWQLPQNNRSAGRRLFRKGVVRFSLWKPREPWKPRRSTR